MQRMIQVCHWQDSDPASGLLSLISHRSHWQLKATVSGIQLEASYLYTGSFAGLRVNRYFAYPRGGDRV